MQKITPFLWFDDQAEEAMNFCVSIFKNSKVLRVRRYGAEGAAVSGRPKGSVMTASFLLDGQEFVALNGGPVVYRITPAISFVVNCETQEEADAMWNGLGRRRRGSPVRLADRQVRRVAAVMQAMQQMKKIDIAALRRAYEQR